VYNIIEPNKYKKVVLKKHHDYAFVLDTFPFKGPVISFTKSANVYLCCFVNTTDTFLMIDTRNRHIPLFIKDKDIASFLVLSSDTFHCPDKVRVSLPKKYLLSSKLKCLCGSLKNLED
jgi:hypothetical protein